MGGYKYQLRKVTKEGPNTKSVYYYLAGADGRCIGNWELDEQKARDTMRILVESSQFSVTEEVLETIPFTPSEIVQPVRPLILTCGCGVSLTLAPPAEDTYAQYANCICGRCFTIVESRR